MNRVLVCIDGSLPYTESCFEYAKWMLKNTDSKAEILYVSELHPFDLSILADISGSLGVQPYQNLYTQLHGIEKEKAKAIELAVDKFFKKEKTNHLIKFYYRTGSLVDVCQDFEDTATGLDMILLGKRGENANFATEHIGSSMERVVRASSKPCFVVPRKFIPIKKILIAYDASSSVNKGIQFLLRSNIFKDASIDLVDVCNDVNIEDEQLLAINKAENELKNVGYDVTTKLIKGDVCDIIANYTIENSIDMLIIGAYGHGPIRRLIIGSTTTDLIRRCKIAVLLFK